MKSTVKVSIDPHPTLTLFPPHAYSQLVTYRHVARNAQSLSYKALNDVLYTKREEAPYLEEDCLHGPSTGG